MTEKEQSTQEAILVAAIDCINKHGIEQVTTRMIAEVADANIASINYYFRTKAHLIEEALKVTISHMLEDVMVTLGDDSLSFRQTLSDIFYYLIDGAQNNPGVSTAHLYSLVIEKDYESIGGRIFLAAFEQVLNLALGAFPTQDPHRLRALLSSIFSAIMFNMLTPGYFQLTGKYQLGDKSRKNALAEHYTEMFYAMMAE